MNIELTEEQSQAVRKGEVVRLTVPGLDSGLVLLRAADYERLHERFEGEREKAAWAKLARKAADRWAEENPYQP